jgi:ascorbate PTS system EIIB component
MRILAVCGNGMGSSNIIRMKIQKISKELGLTATVDHASLAVGKSKAINYDLIFCANNFLDNLKDLEKRGIGVIGIRNLMSEEEIKGKFQEYLNSKK